MAITTSIIGIAIILVVGFIFYAEISSGVSGFFADQDLKSQNDALDIKPDENTLATCDLVITIKGELEHDFLGTLAQGGIADLEFKFGEGTFFPAIAEWQFTHCQGGNLQIASFIPRLPTNIMILQEVGIINDDITLTTNQLFALDITDVQQLSFSGNEQEVRQQAVSFNLSVDDLQTNDLILFWDESYVMRLKIKQLDGVSFRECNSFNQNLCKELIWKAGIVEEPATFEKTFLIKGLPLEEYDIEIVIENQRINDLAPNQPFVYNVRF